VRINSQPTGQSAQAQSSGAIGFAAGSYSQPVNAAFSDFKLTTRG
jgi:hypothetical protein